MQTVPQGQMNIYFCTVPHSRYVFRDGAVATFTSGRFLTDNPSQIAELDWEIKNRHPTIWVDKDNLTIDPKMLDPMEVMKAKIIAEYLEDQRLAATLNPNNDMGNNERASNLNVANSRTIAPLAAGGSGVSLMNARAIPAGLLPQNNNVPANLAKALDLGAAAPVPPAVLTEAAVANQTINPNADAVGMQILSAELSGPIGDPTPAIVQNRGPGVDLSALKLG